MHVNAKHHLSVWHKPLLPLKTCMHNVPNVLHVKLKLVASALMEVKKLTSIKNYIMKVNYND